MFFSVPPSNAANASPHANLRTLRGTQPGLLDPSQAFRLLRFPDSLLFFASFDPKTAFVEDPSTQKLNISRNLTPPKRVVVETTPKGAKFWRFVPRAHLEDGAQDEGIWPRVVDICGEKVQCYQEQWEIYKLDPIYQCVVYPWPKYPTITRVELPNQGFETADPCSSKRSRQPSPETSEPITQKRACSHHADEADEIGFDSDQDGGEEMIIDDSSPQKSRSDRKSDRESREKIRKARLERWQKNRMAHDKKAQGATIPADGSFRMRVDNEDTFPSENPTLPTEQSVKREGSLSPESDSEDNLTGIFRDRFPRGHKRARTLSPDAARAAVNHCHARHEKRRTERLRQYNDLNRQYRQKKVVEALRSAFVPQESVSEVDDEAETSTTEAYLEAQDGPGEMPLDPGSREAVIAESIRKLRELEQDRPIWEAHRKQREARERAEEQERLAKVEQRRQEEEQRQRQQREIAERERRQQAERCAREEERRQRESGQRRQWQRWESGPWTTHRALERFRMLSDEFDTAKFTPEQPISFRDIPWPVLHPPSRLTVEDVDWLAVETFFATVKSHMRLQDYRDFVEKSHRRFHPDRWRARKVWTAVTDEVERGYMEVAANTVAQAITPIWRAAKEK